MILDVMLERRIDDYLNVAGDRDSSDAIHNDDSQCWMKNFQTDIPGPGERLRKKQTTSWPDYLWPEIWKDMSDAAQRKEKQKWALENPKVDNARRLRVFTSSILQMRSARKLVEMRGESWKFQCQQLCLARSREESTRRLVALLILARHNTHASLKPTNLRESVWKELYIEIMETALQEKIK